MSSNTTLNALNALFLLPDLLLSSLLCFCKFFYGKRNCSQNCLFANSPDVCLFKDLFYFDSSGPFFKSLLYFIYRLGISLPLFFVDSPGGFFLVLIFLIQLFEASISLFLNSFIMIQSIRFTFFFCCCCFCFCVFSFQTFCGPNVVNCCS